jgi:hypothetical protein
LESLDGAEDGGLQALVRSTLGPRYDRGKSRNVAKVETWLHWRQDQLSYLLDVGQISATDYFNQTNDVLRQAMAEMKEVLGAADFYKVFGQAGDHPEDIHDLDTFLAAEQGANRGLDR